MADQQVFRHSKMHFVCPRWTHLHRRQQSSIGTFHRSIWLVFGCERWLVGMAIRSDYFRLECGYRRKGIYLFKRAARPRQCLRSRQRDRDWRRGSQVSLLPIYDVGTYLLGANMDMIDLSKNSQLVSTGPAIDSRECLGAVVSNGRIFYISQASGFVVSQTYGQDSKKLLAPWQRMKE